MSAGDIPGFANPIDEQRLVMTEAWHRMLEGRGFGPYKTLGERFPDLPFETIQAIHERATTAVLAGRIAPGLLPEQPLRAALAGEQPPFETVRVYGTAEFQKRNGELYYRTVAVEANWRDTAGEVLQELTKAGADAAANYSDTLRLVQMSGPLYYPGEEEQ